MIRGTQRVGVVADRIVQIVASAVAVTALVVAVIAGTQQIATRFLTDQPAVTSEYILRASLIWMTFSALPLCIRAGWLVRVDFINAIVSARTSRFLGFLSAAATAAVMILILVAGVEILDRVRLQHVPVLGISIAWIYFAIPFGAAMSLVTLATGGLGRSKLNGEI
ncbi:TRAP transporter small permease [Roseovarius lutimaris]|nr:TRAP transporter small permease subunit [Roseovarius lutimaris]